ncbi:MAG: lipid-A-disaccharide synthase [Candidatus Omnitrophica bacterium]|nr:lipid-A-disaccharide synthase [Candidatus Omnitrophota bacterium]
MENRSAKILIVTGEESGDMRAAPLVRAIGHYAQQTRFIGIAGDRCRQEGVATFADIRDLAVIGFVEVIKNFSRIKKVFDLTVQKARSEKPDLAILVDYPGFNLRLAVELKKLGIKVVYYVSPQVWAWKASRVKLIKKVVDRMLVLFPFEKDFYAKHNYAADFVGHPLLDEVHADRSSAAFRSELKLDPKVTIIGLLPGSRKNEIVRLLPLMYKAAQLIRQNNPRTQFVLLQAKTISNELLNKYSALAPEGLQITKEYYNGLNITDYCIVASGTATLETGIMGKPMVVVYKTAWLTALIVRLVIKIRDISLVNIIAGKRIVPELIQQDANPNRLAKEVLALLNDQNKTQAMRRELSALRTRLGNPGASQRAARIVVEELAKLRSGL